MQESTNLLRFDEANSDESDKVRFEGRLKLLSRGGVGYSSSPVSSELEEDVSDGVGEVLRDLCECGGATALLP